MIRLAALVLMLSTSIACAQQQQPPGPPRTFSFQVTLDELQTIAAGLNELPYKRAAPVLNKLDMQLQPQLNPPPPAEPPK